MRRSRYAKILATLGPATSTLEQIRALFEAGADAFRLNFSHGSHEEQARRYQAVRAVEGQTKRPIAVVIDLQGPKLRVGPVPRRPGRAGARRRASGSISRASLGDRQRVSVPHPEIFAGDRRRHRAPARRRQDPARGRAGRHGLRRHDRAERRPAVRQQRRQRAERDPAALAAHRQGPARSAVRPRSRRRLGGAVASSSGRRTWPRRAGWSPAARRSWPRSRSPRRSTISTRSSISSEGIMIARGDLGVELPPEDVPGLQKRIIRAARGRRQAGGGRDPDAGIDDQRAGADPRRGLRRRDRGL